MNGFAVPLNRAAEGASQYQDSYKCSSQSFGTQIGTGTTLRPGRDFEYEICGRVATPRLSRLPVAAIAGSKHEPPPRAQFTTRFASGALRLPSLVPEICAVLGGNRVSFGTDQRRGFRDYFTMHIPGSSLHPDPPPKSPRSVVKKIKPEIFGILI